MVDNLNNEKLTEPYSKFSFGSNLGKRAQNGPKIGFFVFFERLIMLVFLGNNP